METYLDMIIHRHICEKMTKSESVGLFNTAVELDPKTKEYSFSESNLKDFFSIPENPYATIIKKSMTRVPRARLAEANSKPQSNEGISKGKNLSKRGPPANQKYSSRQSLKPRGSSLDPNTRPTSSNQEQRGSVTEEKQNEKKIFMHLGTMNFSTGNLDKIEITFEKNFFLNLIASTIESAGNNPEEAFEYLRKW